MYCKSSDAVTFDLGPLLQGQMRITKHKSAYNSLVIGPRGLQCEPTYRIARARNLLMWSDLTFDPCFKIKRGYPNLKGLTTCLLLKNAVCLQNFVSCSLPVDTSCIWSQITTLF